MLLFQSAGTLSRSHTPLKRGRSAEAVCGSPCFSISEVISHMPGDLLFFSRFIAEDISANVGSGMLDASGPVVVESLTPSTIETAGWTDGLLSSSWKCSFHLSSLRLRSGSESPFLSLMIEDGLELSDLSFLKFLKASWGLLFARCASSKARVSPYLFVVAKNTSSCSI